MASQLPPEDHDGQDDNYVFHTYAFDERVNLWKSGIDGAMLMAVQNAIVLEVEKMNGALEKKVDKQMEIIHLGYLVNAQALLDASVIGAQQHAKLVKKIIQSQTNTLDPKVVRKKYLRIKYLISNKLVRFLPMD